MDQSDITSQKPIAERWQNIAKQIATVIQGSGVETFRQAVRQVMAERLAVDCERERREERRRQHLKERGVLYFGGTIPDKPEGNFIPYINSLDGRAPLPARTKLPPSPPTHPEPPACLHDKLPDGWSMAGEGEVIEFQKEQENYNKEMEAHWPKWRKATLDLFQKVKNLGFPEDESGFGYRFDVVCWIPTELDPDKDRCNDQLLPVPSRKLSDVEKITILSAVYDAHSRGAEKVAPFGVSADGSKPTHSLTSQGREENRAALEYFLLFKAAEQLDDFSADLSSVENWLGELTARTEPKARGREPGFLGVTLGEREAVRQVAGTTLTVKFGSKVRPWEMFRELYHAGQDGLSRPEIMKLVWENRPVVDNTLDQHKATANDLLLAIRVEIVPDQRAVWRLAALDS